MKTRNHSKSAITGIKSRLWFEVALWVTGDKPYGNLDATDYKHVVLGFTTRRDAVVAS